MLQVKYLLLGLALAISVVDGSKTYTIRPNRVYTKEPVTRMQHYLRAAQVANQSTTDLIDLTNTENLQYTGPAFFGTPLQGSNSSDFTYDTGSSYLTVTSTECKSCKTKYYDPSKSSTASNSTQYNTTNISYGSADLDGYMGVDVACLSDYN